MTQSLSSPAFTRVGYVFLAATMYLGAPYTNSVTQDTICSACFMCWAAPTLNPTMGFTYLFGTGKVGSKRHYWCTHHLRLEYR